MICFRWIRTMKIYFHMYKIWNTLTHIYTLMWPFFSGRNSWTESWMWKKHTWMSSDYCAVFEFLLWDFYLWQKLWLWNNFLSNILHLIIRVNTVNHVWHCFASIEIQIVADFLKRNFYRSIIAQRLWSVPLLAVSETIRTLRIQSTYKN